MKKAPVSADAGDFCDSKGTEHFQTVFQQELAL